MNINDIYIRTFEDLKEAVEAYGNRDRRYGGVK